MTKDWSRRGFVMQGMGAATASLALGACARSSPSVIEVAQPGGAKQPVPRCAPQVDGDNPQEKHDGWGEVFAELEGFCDGVPPVSAAERASRIDRAQALLRAAKLDALVVESGSTLRYFAGIGWGRSERPLQLILRASPEAPPMLVAPAFEEGTLRARFEALDIVPEDFELLTWQEHESPYARAAQASRLSKGAAKVAFDPETRRFVAEGWTQELSRAQVVDGTSVVEGCRMIKSELELARLRRANEATKAALAAAALRVEPGMKQSEVAAMVRAAQRAAGLSDIWVLALADQSAAYPHGAPSDATVVEGRLVLVDTGGFLHGYASDITRTFGVGEVNDPELRRAYEAVRAAQTAGLAAIRPGRPCGDADEAARAVVATARFGEGYSQFTHRLGHGIGLDVHEAPYLRRDNARPLAAGMTMSNEPGIYRPGSFGVRIEDIVAVTAQGAEVFGPRAGSLDDVFGRT